MAERMVRRTLGLIRTSVMAGLLAGGAGVMAADAAGQDLAAKTEAVRATEIAFAQSMADRDHAAFVTFLAADAIFFSGETPTRGAEAIADLWAGFFEGAEAPFSWVPDLVEVLDSGELAFSSGPVYNAAGEQAGRFNSIWRLEEDGHWRVVFDKGS